MTQVVADSQFNLAMDFCRHALSKGCTPVLTFLAPTNTMNQTEDDIRKALIVRCKATGFVVCDCTTATGDGATPERIVSGYNADSLHLNNTGYMVGAQVMVDVLRDILVRNLMY